MNVRPYIPEPPEFHMQYGGMTVEVSCAGDCVAELSGSARKTEAASQSASVVTYVSHVLLPRSFDHM